MKRRALQTYKILALAVTATATAGCSSAAAPEVQAEPPRPAAASPVQEPAQMRDPTPAPLPQSALEALREELSPLGRDTALQQLAHFRPLCDRDGYPLVGNVMRKAPDPQYQPSQLCAEVRKQAAR